MHCSRFIWQCTAVGVLASISSAVLYGISKQTLLATSFSQKIQNVRADADDLSRMRDDAMILRFRRSGLLLPVPGATSHYYLHGIRRQHRYLRPWTKLFLTRLSRQSHARFGRKLRVTGLVRTVKYQQALQRHNANAAGSVGVLRSSHLTGATLDISKRDMSPAHRQWMRRVLHSLQSRKVIYAIEEFRQPCFHVMVHRRYLEYVRNLQS
jgi:hypothetical protein